MTLVWLKKDTNRAVCFGVAAFLLPVALLFAVYSVVGMHPFGPLDVFLVDAKLQYVSFFSEYVRQVRALELPLFSRFFGFGMNFWGTWSYYLSSPFNLILLLFPQNALPDGIYTLILVKVGACGLSFYLFAHRTLKATPTVALIFSACYALSGFVVNYADNVQWLDALIWLPIVILCIEKLFALERSRFYPFCVAILVISNFHQAVMTGVFAVLYVFYIVIRDARKRTRASLFRGLLRIFWNSLLGVGMSAIVLVPGYFLLRNQMGLIGQDLPAAWLAGNPIDSLRGLFLWSSNLLDSDAPPKIYAGLLAIAAAPIYLFQREIPKRERVATVGFLLLIFLSFHVTLFSFVWHGLDDPNAYPFRYSFCFCFALLMMAVKAVGGPAPSFRRHRIFLAIYLSVILAVLLLAFRTQGVMQMICFSLFSLIFIAAYLYVSVAKNRSKGLLLALVCAELFCNTLIITTANEQVYNYGRYDDFQANTQKVRDALASEGVDGQTGRTVLETRVISGNDPLLFGYSGIDSFSSMGNVYAQNAAFLLGEKYYINGMFEISDDTGSLLFDSLFGVTHIVKESDSVGSGSFSAVPTMLAAPSERLSDLTVLENPASLPIAYLVDDDIRDFIPKDTGVQTLENCDGLLSAMLGKSTHTTTEIPYTCSLSKMRQEVDGDQTLFRPEDEGAGSIILSFSGQGEDSPIYFTADYRDTVLTWQKSTVTATLAVDNAGFVSLAMPEPYATPCALCLGAYPEGTKIQLTVHVSGTDLNVRYMRVAVQNIDTVCKAVAPLRENAASFRWDGNRRASIRLDAKKSGVLFLSIPYDQGWRITRNGEPVEPLCVVGAFMGIPVDKGTNDIEMQFVPPGLEAGALLACGFLLLTVAQNVAADIRTRKKAKKDLSAKGDV